MRDVATMWCCYCCGGGEGEYLWCFGVVMVWQEDDGGTIAVV